MERSGEQVLTVLCLPARAEVVPSSLKMTTNCCLHWWS